MVKYRVRQINRRQTTVQSLQQGALVSYESTTNGGRVMCTYIGPKATKLGKTLAQVRRHSDSKIVSIDPVKKNLRLEQAIAPNPSPWAVASLKNAQPW